MNTAIALPVSGPIYVKDGRFNSKEIYVSITDPVQLITLATIYAQVKASNTKGAIFLYVDEFCLALVLSWIHSEKLRFHRYLNKQYVYYFWNVPNVEDKVPEYATSIEGAGALILSPDEAQVLLVWEYGKWKAVTGAVKSGDLNLDTMLREVEEEVQVKLDHSFEPKYLGGWNFTKARMNKINDNFSCYVVRAASKEFQVDEFEIHKAQWFDVSYLLSIINNSSNISGTDDLTSASLKADNTAFSYAGLIFLGNYVNKRYLSIRNLGNVNLIC